MEFRIPALHLIPYVRMTQRGKWKVPKAQRYMDNQAALAWEFKRLMLANGWEMIAPRQEIYVKYRIYRSGQRYKTDLDNLLKAILDAAQGVVFKDDRFITVDLGGGVVYGTRDEVWAEFGLVAELPDANKIS